MGPDFWAVHKLHNAGRWGVGSVTLYDVLQGGGGGETSPKVTPMLDGSIGMVPVYFIVVTMFGSRGQWALYPPRALYPTLPY